jgi:signal transduction histidine kinase
MMSSSLTLKLVLAFLIVSLLGVALVAVFSRVITEREFDRLALAQAKDGFIAEATAYYQTYGSWQGIDRAFRRPPPPGSAPRPPRPPQFGLVNLENRVVLPGGPYRVGERVPADIVNRGTPVEIEGQVVGTILFTDTPPPRNPIEEQYLARTNRTVLIAAIAAAIMALGLGVVLARTLTRPLRELTTATLAMAKGDLVQTVPVRSQDELGQLARSFNRMSTDLARANQLRRQMTADIAHDLRTPLTVISGYLEALRDGDLKPTPARLEAMYTEVQHLKRLVADLRTLSLADAGELSLNRQRVSVPELLNRVATAYRHQAERQQITLSLQAEKTVPDIEADSERLVQVLGNLMSNALRYTPEGGQIVLAARSQANRVLVQVKDTGPGISPAELPHIFHRFYRGDQSRRQTEGESGLGLAIAKAIVEAHGGTITADSTVGQGTTFSITLPIAG